MICFIILTSNNVSCLDCLCEIHSLYNVSDEEKAEGEMDRRTTATLKGFED